MDKADKAFRVSCLFCDRGLGLWGLGSSPAGLGTNTLNTLHAESPSNTPPAPWPQPLPTPCCRRRAAPRWRPPHSGAASLHRPPRCLAVSPCQALSLRPSTSAAPGPPAHARRRWLAMNGKRYLFVALAARTRAGRGHPLKETGDRAQGLHGHGMGLRTAPHAASFTFPKP